LYLGGLVLFLASLLAMLLRLLIVAEVLLEAFLLDLAEGYLVARLLFLLFLLLIDGNLGLLSVGRGSIKKLDACSGY
jgi:hypothetical protein